MKKLIITLSASMLFFACKKDYTCECTTTPGNSVDKYTIKNATKRQAKANCFSYSLEDTSSGTTTKVEVTCDLK